MVVSEIIIIFIISASLFLLYQWKAVRILQTLRRLVNQIKLSKNAIF